jgi:hypothetical protein
MPRSLSRTICREGLSDTTRAATRFSESLRSGEWGPFWPNGPEYEAHPDAAIRASRSATPLAAATATVPLTLDAMTHRVPRKDAPPIELSSNSSHAGEPLGQQVIHDGPQVLRAMRCVRLNRSHSHSHSLLVVDLLAL